MAAQYHCTQLLNQFPEPGTDESINGFVTSSIGAVVSAYRPYHYYLLTSLVVFAFFANILIVIVLSNKEMRSSGINVTMMLIAVCDLGCASSGLFQQFLRRYSE
ncbi:unnamed protein product [Caenorhabditis nigoni]